MTEVVEKKEDQTQTADKPHGVSFLATMVILSIVPFEDNCPDDLVIEIKGENKQGLIVDVSNNMDHTPLEDSQLAAWLIAQATYLGIPPKIGTILYARAEGINYLRRFQSVDTPTTNDSQENDCDRTADTTTSA